ncbi:MAG TPA: hypothetical protein VLF40_03000, partial [Candidatus Saccharimonadales bacterium]|nr:hypothetical protein [Candidatus Saccharimonadales bacterium]
MLQVESAVACEGGNGTYEVLLHFLRFRRQAGFMRLLLPSRPDKVERELDMAGGIPDPWAIIELAEGVANQKQQLKRVGAPAITSLVRYCERATHADGVRTGTGGRRLEAAARIIWVPHNAARIAVHAWLTELNHQGIGQAEAVNPVIDSLSPVVSAPLTRSEAQWAHDRPRAEAIHALPSTNPGNIIFALVH